MSNDSSLLEGVRPSRRTIVRSAAWTVPVVAVATTAPAFAASPCDVTAYRLDWNGGAPATGTTSWSRGSHQSGSATINPPAGSEAGSIGVTFASTWINEASGPNRDRRDKDLNLTVSAETNVGGLGQGRGLYIRHESPIDGNRTRRQQITITFSRPVTGLNFRITDVDSTVNQYWDRVELVATSSTGADALFTPALSAGMAGDGSAASPFRQTNDNTSYDPNESGGNVGISFGSNTSVKTMTIQFWSSEAGGQQAVYLSDMAFSARGC